MTIVGPDGRKIYCNRAILSVCSTPFARMLSSEMAEGRAREIRIQQVDSRALELMVQYFYTGELFTCFPMMYKLNCVIAFIAISLLHHGFIPSQNLYNTFWVRIR